MIEGVDYGKGLSGTTTAATAGSGTITNSGGQAFSWVQTQHKAYVQNHPSSGQTLYVVWNGTSASTTAWDVVLEAGKLAPSPDGITMDAVQVHASGAVTYGTDFVVKGFR